MAFLLILHFFHQNQAKTAMKKCSYFFSFLFVVYSTTKNYIPFFLYYHSTYLFSFSTCFVPIFLCLVKTVQVKMPSRSIGSNNNNINASTNSDLQQQQQQQQQINSSNNNIGGGGGGSWIRCRGTA